MDARPVIFVLAGVNGAGKSSIGGHMLRQGGMSWFNPDDFARELQQATGCAQHAANACAWSEGMRRLENAMVENSSYAFETTLGGNTVPARIEEASKTHDVLIWFCGLTSPEQHIARVNLRVHAGGHDIPEAKIRERYPAALANLIQLMPLLRTLMVYDNSVEVEPNELLPDPTLVLSMEDGKLTWPADSDDLLATPEWAKPLVQAALELSGR